MDLPLNTKTHTLSRAEFCWQTSSFENVLGLGFLVAKTAFVSYHLSTPYAAMYAWLWAFLCVRIHLNLWWHGAVESFVFLCRRFPVAYFNTLSCLPFFAVLKVSQFVLLQFNPIADHGRDYKVLGGGIRHISTYVRYALDLEKPLVTRSWSRPCVYPFLCNTRIASNIYCVGPLLAFGVLQVHQSDTHTIFHNDLLSTHPVNNQYVVMYIQNGMLHVTEQGQAIWPVRWLYHCVWSTWGVMLYPAICEHKARLQLDDEIMKFETHKVFNIFTSL